MTDAPGRPRRLLPPLAGVLVSLAILVAPGVVHDGTGTASAKRAGPLQLITQSSRLTGADQTQRLTVECPGRAVPLGGGMVATPSPGPDGEGAYPQSFERLGVQRGWHVTAVLYDPSRDSTTPRDVTLQVLCGRKFGHVTPPRITVYVSPGETKRPVATCAGRLHLIGGGFQRTDFTSQGGDYVTESRAISSKSWRVTGHAFGGYGGELTAIAYCLRSKRPLVTQVSGSTSIAPRSAGTAQTTMCPSGRKLVFGGFRTNPVGSTLFTDGSWTSDARRAATGFNTSGSPSTLTVFGYCLGKA